MIESNVIYPKIMGSSLGLPGIWVLVAVTLGGSLFGIIGMLIGVPIVASVYKIAEEGIAKREKKIKSLWENKQNKNIVNKNINKKITYNKKLK